MTRLRAVCLAAALAVAALPAAAQTIPGAITGLAMLTSDYTFRGISQSDSDPAIQAGLEYGVEVGSLTPYLGIWGSSVNFTDANIELDVTGGVRGKIGDVGWDLGFVYYVYPNARSTLNYDFVEIAGKLSYDFGMAALTVGANYTTDYFGGSGDALYLQANVDVPLPWGLVGSAHIGHQSIDKNAVFGAPDYLDWSLGVTKEVLGIALGLSYVDTDLSRSECFAGTALCGGRVIVSATKKF